MREKQEQDPVQKKGAKNAVLQHFGAYFTKNCHKKNTFSQIKRGYQGLRRAQTLEEYGCVA